MPVSPSMPPLETESKEQINDMTDLESTAEQKELSVRKSIKSQYVDEQAQEDVDNTVWMSTPSNNS